MRLGCVSKCLLNVGLICLVDLTIFLVDLIFAMVKLHDTVAIPFATALNKIDDLCYPALQRSRKIRYYNRRMELVDVVLSLLGEAQRKAMTPMKAIMKAMKPMKKKTNKVMKARKAKKARKA